LKGLVRSSLAFCKIILLGETHLAKRTNLTMSPGTSQRTSFAVLLLILFCVLAPFAAFSQEPAGAGSGRTSLPDAPKPQQNANPALDTTAAFVGYMTNPSVVFPDIAHSVGPLSTGQKFKLFVNQSISPPYVIVATISSAYDQAIDTKGFGQGWDAYGWRFGSDMARASSNSFFSTFVFASAFHQDPRFFPQSHPTVWGSVKYSAKRVFVTFNDSGKDTFNTSGILGAGAAEGLANVYLPGAQQGAGKTFERIGIDLAWKFAGNMFKDYWPTFFHDLGLNRLKVIPDPSGMNPPENH
jgi:hypothetical protein